MIAVQRRKGRPFSSISSSIFFIGVEFQTALRSSRAVSIPDSQPGMRFSINPCPAQARACFLKFVSNAKHILVVSSSKITFHINAARRRAKMSWREKSQLAEEQASAVATYSHSFTKVRCCSSQSATTQVAEGSGVSNVASCSTTSKCFDTPRVSLRVS